MAGKTAKDMLKKAYQVALPNKMVIFLDPKETQKDLGKINAYLKTMSLLNKKSTAYVCINFACKRPTNELETLQAQLVEVVWQNGQIP